jgi:sirohydrochlorin cobaltochelatase
MSNELSQKTSCLVFIAHGSRNPQWTAPFRELANDLRKEVGDKSIYLAFMELSQPTLMDLAETIVQDGISHIRLLPLFLSSGNHLAYDLPAQVAAVQQRYPALEMEVLPHVGQHPKFIRFLHNIIKEQIG